MAFVLDKLDDMKNIYVAAKKVYDREITAETGVQQLMIATQASASSLKMYFNIYASMRKGKCYKMGTSASFTKFLLEQIYLELGEDALRTALEAAKLHAEYRASVNNEQPGIEKVCREVIIENHVNINYDGLPEYNLGEDSCPLSGKEKATLLGAIQKSNAEFSKILMSLAEQYQIFSSDDLYTLCDKQKSRKLFDSDYSYLKEVDTAKNISVQLKSADGRNRYYGDTYVFNDRTYVVTSQLYGLAGGSGHKNNRNPFYEWILEKFGVIKNISDWWPSEDEYDPRITIEQWLEMLNNPDVFSSNSLAMFACMYKLGGAATCKQLSAAFGQDSGYYNMVAFHTAEKVQAFTNCPMPPAEKRSKWWPILFVGRDATEYERGTFVWKIREELYEALEEFNVLQYLPNNKIGIFDSWEIIDEDTAMKTCDKSFFDYNSSGVPKGICWFFDAEYLDAGQSRDVVILYDDSEFIAKVSNDTTDRRRVKISWNQDLGMLLNSYKGKSKCKAVFSKMDTGYYKLLIKCGEKEMTVKEQVAVIKEYIATKGFNYEGNLIENFYLSLKSKPFVILAGTSGTGKTRLVKLFAEAIDAKVQLVPVRPDWSDSSDLFGHVDLSGSFQPGAIIDFIREAQSNQAKPFILCLDEMNLARVEYYLSDFLSIIETREWDDNQVIVSDALMDVTDYKNDTEKRDCYGQLIIPENLYIVGTVNMDETTFPFSKKVLDRANTIEFSFVNLMPRRNEQFEQVRKQSLNNTFLKTSYLYLSDCDDTEYVDKVCFELEQLNQILVKANLHVGYRVRDEICFYMMNNKQADLISDEAAYDNAIMQKILPRIQGSSVAIKEVLCDLFIKLEGDYTGISAGLAYEQMEKYIAEKGSKYPNTANKLAFMVRRYEEDGFTSYWL